MSVINNKMILELSDANEEVEVALKSLSVSGMSAYGEIAGMESFGTTATVVADKVIGATASIGASLMNIASWAGGKTIPVIRESFGNANRTLTVNFGTNSMGINKIINDLKSKNPKADFDIPAATVASLTSTGKMSDFRGDLEDMKKTIDLVYNHTKDVDGYLRQRLAIMKELTGTLNNEKAANVLNKLNTLKKPQLRFPNHPSENTFVSEVLPGGKVLKFTATSNGESEYSMSGDKPSGDISSNPYGSSEWSECLKRLLGINEANKSIIKINESYVKFINDWGTAVKSLSDSIEKQDGLSVSFKRDIERLMSGDKDYLLFYSGFLPRVISHVNAVIANTLKLVTKLI